MEVIPTEDMVVAMWVIIGCGIWGVMMGVTIVSCYMDDLEQEEYESLGNEQWQRDQDELEDIEN